MESRIKIGDEPLKQALDPFLRGYQTSTERIAALEAALGSEHGKFWRQELGMWTVRMVPVELLVPDVYRQWRPLVRDAMLFVVSRLSAARLAPKVVEQITLAPETPAEVRLLRFIARVPGLQKVGQVLARNRNLDPRLRRALTELENAISDVSTEEVCARIRQELGPLIETYAVRIDAAILSEASVSAVVGFSWRNPKSRRRERGVFKVLKPHIPSCYAEDMEILRQLAVHLARKHRGGGVRLGGVAETLAEIRLLLQHEVDFRREQATLSRALRPYRSIPGVRVPKLVEPLSSDTVTALGRENGKKITEAVARSAANRVRVARRLAEALIAVPALAREKDSIFHADPHAGNLLYDKRREELVILDWALTEHLTRAQRKNVLMLIFMMLLQDGDGMVAALERLRLHRAAHDREEGETIRQHVIRFLDEVPLSKWPFAVGVMEAIRLLDQIALDGIRFPSGLLMFRKAAFTLDGVLEDIAGSRVRWDSIIAEYAQAHWMDACAALFSLLSASDWVALDWSALTLAFRLCARAFNRLWPGSPRTILVPRRGVATSAAVG